MKSYAVPAGLRHLFLVNAPVSTAPEHHAVERYATVERMVGTLKPEFPVHCLRTHTIKRAATWFLNHFPGRVMYAVKTNPEPLALAAVYQAGVRDFDVASLAEVREVATRFADAKLFFMHPVKSREAIAESYHRYGVRAFSLDSEAELAKILERTNHAEDLELFIRIAIPNEHAAYALTGKFGANPQQAVHLLRAARPHAKKLGVCFHVGSQCMDPADYAKAMQRVRAIMDDAGVTLDAVDIGGGFPSTYPGMTPPPMASFMDAITQAKAAMKLEEGTEFFCEPGRALVAESGSLVVRVELRKGDALYLNDGTYGSLFDAGHPGFVYPVQAIRPNGAFTGELAPFSFFGPTCDSLDAMKGPFLLPADIEEGDWIEIGQMGAYGSTMRTRFNGFYSDALVELQDQPLMSLFHERQ